MPRSSRTRPRLPLPLRVVVLVLLALSAVMQPVLAANCAICDGTYTLADRSAVALSDSQTHDGTACCSFADCGECCMQAANVTPLVGVAPVVSVAAPAVPALALNFEPVAVAVPFRPPIAS